MAMVSEHEQFLETFLSDDFWRIYDRSSGARDVVLEKARSTCRHLRGETALARGVQCKLEESQRLYGEELTARDAWNEELEEENDNLRRDKRNRSEELWAACAPLAKNAVYKDEKTLFRGLREALERSLFGNLVENPDNTRKKQFLPDTSPHVYEHAHSSPRSRSSALSSREYSCEENARKTSGRQRSYANEDARSLSTAQHQKRTCAAMETHHSGSGSEGKLYTDAARQCDALRSCIQELEANLESTVEANLEGTVSGQPILKSKFKDTSLQLACQVGGELEAWRNEPDIAAESSCATHRLSGSDLDHRVATLTTVVSVLQEERLILTRFLQRYMEHIGEESQGTAETGVERVRVELGKIQADEVAGSHRGDGRKPMEWECEMESMRNGESYWEGTLMGQGPFPVGSGYSEKHQAIRALTNNVRLIEAEIAQLGCMIGQCQMPICWSRPGSKMVLQSARSRLQNRNAFLVESLAGYGVNVQNHRHGSPHTLCSEGLRSEIRVLKSKNHECVQILHGLNAEQGYSDDEELELESENVRLKIEIEELRAKLECERVRACGSGDTGRVIRNDRRGLEYSGSGSQNRNPLMMDATLPNHTIDEAKAQLVKLIDRFVVYVVDAQTKAQNHALQFSVLDKLGEHSTSPEEPLSTLPEDLGRSMLQRVASGTLAHENDLALLVKEVHSFREDALGRWSPVAKKRENTLPTYSRERLSGKSATCQQACPSEALEIEKLSTTISNGESESHALMKTRLETKLEIIDLEHARRFELREEETLVTNRARLLKDIDRVRSHKVAAQSELKTLQDELMCARATLEEVRCEESEERKLLMRVSESEGPCFSATTSEHDREELKREESWRLNLVHDFKLEELRLCQSVEKLRQQEAHLSTPWATGDVIDDKWQQRAMQVRQENVELNLEMDELQKKYQKKLNEVTAQAEHIESMRLHREHLEREIGELEHHLAHKPNGRLSQWNAHVSNEHGTPATSSDDKPESGDSRLAPGLQRREAHFEREAGKQTERFYEQLNEKMQKLACLMTVNENLLQHLDISGGSCKN